MQTLHTPPLDAGLTTRWAWTGPAWREDMRLGVDMTRMTIYCTQVWNCQKTLKTLKWEQQQQKKRNNEEKLYIKLPRNFHRHVIKFPWKKTRPGTWDKPTKEVFCWGLGGGHLTKHKLYWMAYLRIKPTMAWEHEQTLEGFFIHISKSYNVLLAASAVRSADSFVSPPSISCYYPPLWPLPCHPLAVLPSF